MFGKFLSSVFKVVTLPVDAASAAADMATGGDGSKESRTTLSPLGELEILRDHIADAAKDIDKDE